MGEYFKVRDVEGLRCSAAEPLAYDKNVRGYFKWLKVVGTGKESSPISHLSLSPADGLCAVSFGTKVQFYDYESQCVTYNYSSSKSFVRCASFRPDAKLAAVSDDSGAINVVAISLKSHLRRFTGHQGPVYAHKFSADKLSLVSGGDDATVRLWDVAAEKCVLTLEGHSDRVRALCPVPGDANLWVTGSYDKASRVFDVRSPAAPVATLAQDAPVEHVSTSSSGFRLLTSGGNRVKVWDLAAGLRLESALEPHMRTVTGAYLSDDDSCLVTASLDGTVRFTEFATGALRHTYAYGAEVTAFDFRYNNVLAVGLASGDWLVRHNPKAGARMQNDAPGEPEAAFARQAEISASAVEVVGYKPPKLGLLDRLVKTFQYRAAMDLAVTLT